LSDTSASAKIHNMGCYPGRWQVKFDPVWGHTKVVDSSGRLVVDASKADGTTEEKAANAAMAAMSPDFVEVLEKLMYWMKTQSRNYPHLLETSAVFEAEDLLELAYKLRFGPPR
jgi:hypothetical protein